MCPKKPRQSNAQELTDANERANLSSDDRRKMIDRLVDVGLARYLEKSRDKMRDDKLEGTSADRDFRRHFYDWAMTNEDKRKRTCVADEKFTTMKPGSIIKDSVPIEQIVVLEAPYMDESLQSNLSDKAFHEAGDRVGVGIDTSQQKIYKGAQAIKLIEQLAHRDSTTRTTRTTSTAESEDRGASIDVASEESR